MPLIEGKSKESFVRDNYIYGEEEIESMSFKDIIDKVENEELCNNDLTIAISIISSHEEILKSSNKEEVTRLLKKYNNSENVSIKYYASLGLQNISKYVS